MTTDWTNPNAPLRTESTDLAAELRGILDDYHDAEHGNVPKVLVRERLERLAEHVERLAAEPVEATTELTASFGLDPEQEIRARAALTAATALGPAIAAAVAGPFSPEDFGRGRDALVNLTGVFIALIRDGSRPGEADTR
jgi:hypothetical protein